MSSLCQRYPRPQRIDVINISIWESSQWALTVEKKTKKTDNSIKSHNSLQTEEPNQFIDSNNITMSSSQRILACTMLLFLQMANAFQSTTTATKSSSQLSMAWTLPNQPSFQPTWYQDCGNPCLRQVVYDDDELLDDDMFYVANFGSDWSVPVDATEEQEVLPRGARIGRVARRAVQGIRNTLRP